MEIFIFGESKKIAMFISIKEFKSDGYWYDEKTDTKVLEYLYPVAQYFKPEYQIFHEEMDDTSNVNMDEDLGITEKVTVLQLPTYAVKDFVFRYNCVEKDKRNKLHPDYREKNLASVVNLEKRKLKVEEYQEIINRNKESNKKILPNIQDYIKLYQLDAEKFWYLFLFISDFVEGLCIKNIEVENSSFQETMKFMNTILKNTTTQEPMKLEIKIGDKHPVKIDNNHAIFYMAFAIEHLKDKLEHNVPDFTNRRAKFDMSIPQSAGTILSYFTKMFIQFFNSTKSVYKTRKKGGEISNQELLFIHLLFKLSGLAETKTNNPTTHIRKLLERNQDDPKNVTNRYYLF